jgi:AbrB family looped-hinge helix DNA binding protein
MRTTLSTNGQVVVPGTVRRRLNLHPGDAFGVEVVDGRIVLTPLTPRKYGITI